MKARQILILTMSLLLLFVSVSEAQLTASSLSASAVSSSQINLTWNDPNKAEAGYSIERSTGNGFTVIATTGKNATSYSDIGLTAGTTYSYRIRAFKSNEVSSYSNIASATTHSPDTTAPSVSITSPASGTTYTTAQTVTITASASDNVGVSRVEFYQNGVLKGTDTTNPYAYSWSFTASENGTHSWTARAYDGAGNSTLSSPISLTVNISSDTTPPTGSIFINNNATYTNTTSVTLNLSASDASGVAQMCISNTTSCSAWEAYATSKAWTIPTGDGTKTVYAWFRDSAGNTSSAYSDSIILDATPPASSITINNNATYTTTTSVTLTLSSSDSLSGVSQMCISNTTSCPAWEAYATSKAWTLPTGDGTKTVYAWFRDSAGNTSPAYSDSIILDATAPSVPTGLTGAASSCSQIDLSWTASTDTGGSGLRGYNVYRNNSFIKQVTTTSTSDTGLSASTVYTYTVSAVDNAGNQSAQSSSVSINTPPCADTTAPTVSITSPSSGTTYTTAQTVTITASASDNVGVSKVEFYQNGVLRSTDTTSPYTHSWSFTGSENGTHSWTARAYDGAGNSTLSSSVTLTVNIASSSGGQYLWAQNIGGSISTDFAYGNSVITDVNGNVVVVGRFSGIVDFGGGYLSSAGGDDIFIAKYSPTGSYLWSKRLGGSSSETARSVTLDSQGNIIITGDFSNTSDFGGGSFTSAGWTDIFIAKYSPNGEHLWSKRFGSTSTDISNVVSVDINDNIIVSGRFVGSVDFGGGILTSAGGFDVFIAKYSPTGSHLWSRRLGGVNSDYVNAAAVDINGNIAITGYFSGSASFGGDQLTSAGDRDIFVARYSATGMHLWSKGYGNSGYDVGEGIAVDGDSNVIVTGIFSGSVNFGGSTLVSNGTADMFIAKYSSTGAHIWSKNFGGSSTYDVTPRSVATDHSGNILITGTIADSVSFGGDPLWSNSSYDIFIVKFTPTASHLWSKRFGVLWDDTGKSVTADKTGNVFLVGDFYEAVDLGGGMLYSPGGINTFVAKFAP